jgi:hypothetical protein
MRRQEQFVRRKVLILGAMALCAIVFAGWCYIYWCRAIVVDEDLNGLNFEQVIARCGQPNRNNVFILTDTLLEYRYGLLNLFPQYRDSSIEIMEMLWVDSSGRMLIDGNRLTIFGGLGEFSSRLACPRARRKCRNCLRRRLSLVLTCSRSIHSVTVNCHTPS